MSAEPSCLVALGRHGDPALLARVMTYAGARLDDSFGDTQLRARLAQSNEELIPKSLALQVRVPACADGGLAFVEHLMREIELLAPLVARDRDVLALAFDGAVGTLSHAALTTLMASLQRHFHFTARSDREFEVTLDPRVVVPQDVAIWAAFGFNRVRLAVQDLDPAVQRRQGREQPTGSALAILDECRARGFRTTTVELACGLPGQTLAGFDCTLDAIIWARPHRVHVRRAVSDWRWVDEAAGASAVGVVDTSCELTLCELTFMRLTAEGYRHIGLDHFVGADDDLMRARDLGRLTHGVRGYSALGMCDVLGLGPGAISHIGDSYSQNPQYEHAWRTALDAGRLPVARGMTPDTYESICTHVIEQILCRGVIDFAELELRYNIDCRAGFADALARLAPFVARRAVEIEPYRIIVTSYGMRMLSIIAACFEAARERVTSTRDTDRR